MGGYISEYNRQELSFSFFYSPSFLPSFPPPPPSPSPLPPPALLLFLSPSLPSSAYTVMWKQMDVINKFYGMLEVDECYGIRKIVWSTEEYWVESARGVYRWVVGSNFK